MNIRRVLAMIGIVAIALLLAFPLRETVYESVIIPIAGPTSTKQRRIRKFRTESTVALTPESARRLT